MFQTVQKLSQGDTTVHCEKVVPKWHHSCQKVVSSCSKWCSESMKIEEHKDIDHNYYSSINAFYIINLAIFEGITGTFWYSSFPPFEYFVLFMSMYILRLGD